jgi:DNA repair protein RadC
MEGDPKKGFRISDMRNEEKPRERMAAQGSTALAVRELLAILLRVGTKLPSLKLLLSWVIALKWKS